MADTISNTAPTATAIPAIPATGASRETIDALDGVWTRDREGRAWADALRAREEAVLFRDRFYAENDEDMRGPDHRYHEAIGDGLCEHVNAADDTLIATPAPNLPALAIKLAIAVGDKEGCDLTDERRESIMCDVARLIP